MLVLMTYNLGTKSEKFIKMNKRIPFALVFLVMKTNKSIRSLYQRKVE